MDFFENQERARKKTGLLVLYFVLAVILIILTLYVAAELIFTWGGRYLSDKSGAQPTFSGPESLWNPLLFVGVTLTTLVVVMLGTVFKMSALSGGGQRVAEMLGGRLLSPETTDRGERRLLNVVEEMALASGMAVPPVYLMENEAGINAFAAGYSPDSAVLGVTRGTVNLLDRDELQGVIGHEFSHILNGDMRLNIRLIGLLHGILVLAIIGQLILRGMGRGSRVSSGSSKNKGGAGIAAILAFALVLMIVGYIGVFFGRLIKSAVSRQREYLADASAVQFTRDPLGLAGALKKIGAAGVGSKISAARAEEASHLFFSNGLKKNMSGMLSTHPPLLDRIMRLDPSFDGVFPQSGSGKSGPRRSRLRKKPPPVPTRKSPMPGFGGGLPGMPDLPGVGEAIPGVLQIPVLAALAASPQEVLQLIGAPMEGQLDQVRGLLEALPDELRHAAHETYGARAVIYALLMDADEQVHTLQVELLENQADRGMPGETQRLLGFVRRLQPEQVLPLVDLTIPALRGLSEEQYRSFRDTINGLVAADQEIDLFEYALGKTLLRSLEQHFDPPKPVPVEIYAVRGVVQEISIVLSMLARLGGGGEEEAKKAFEAAVAHVADPRADYALVPESDSGLAAVDQALEKLRSSSALVKKKVTVAALQCLVSDGEITIREAELFRALSGALDIPVPPWVVASAPPPGKM